MYTIYTLVGREDNSRVFPIVYVLTTSKSEESYTRLFQELIDLGDEANQSLDPPMILTDFELAAINAVQTEFPGSINKDCFFHLCQNVWKKIQASGLAIEYGSNTGKRLIDRVPSRLVSLFLIALPTRSFTIVY